MITLASAFATKRMTGENFLVRVLGSCETMADVSVVCTDNTGTLTQNVMTVVAGSVGVHAKFARPLGDDQSRMNDVRADASEHADNLSLDQTHLNDVLTPQLQKLFNEAIAINSTAFEDPETGVVGSKTEIALLSFAKELGWENFKSTRDNANIVQVIPFSGERNTMGVVVKVREGQWRLYLKGASENLSKQCTSRVVVDKNRKGVASDEVETAPIDQFGREEINRTIISYANQTLRTIALCYRDLDLWPPRDLSGEVVNDVCLFYILFIACG